VTAANGTKIDIIGKKRFSIKLNGIHFEADMLVSLDVDEAMIGADFLIAHNACWQFWKEYNPYRWSRVETALESQPTILLPYLLSQYDYNPSSDST